MILKRNPAGGRGDVVHLNNFNPNSTTQLNPHKTCLSCGCRFIPAQAFYRLCGQCYADTKAGNHLQMAARFLKGVRHG